MLSGAAAVTPGAAMRSNFVPSKNPETEGHAPEWLAVCGFVASAVEVTDAGGVVA